jgi:hypothetical protein
MANIQIPNLPAVAALSGAELFEGVQAGTSVKISLDQVIAASRGGTPTTLPLAVSVGGTGADNPADARTNLGLGTISTQNSNSVTITGGSITGITDLAVADGGTGVSTLTGYVKGNGTSPFTASATVPSTDITGLGTMSVQNANNVTLTGGSITGITDLAVADGGTGLSTYTVGDILYASAISTLAKLPDVATGNALISGGVGVAPLYGKIGLTTHVSGVLTVSNGGTGASTLTGYVKGSGTATLTASATIPNTDVSGLGTMSVQDATSVTISGGSINGTSIGASSASTIKATTGNFSGDLTLESAQPTIAFAETDTTNTDARVRLNGGSLIFDTTTDGGVLVQENMRITSIGRVGIGTNGPTTLLDVAGTANATNMTRGGSQVYSRDNILATVSQTAGVPTGGIIEKGSNANGEYVRYADGTLICWNYTTTSQDTTTANGSVFRTTNTDTWTFPSVFAVAPVGSGQADNSARWISLGTPSTTSTTFRQFAAATSATLSPTRLMAIGRWF